MNNLETFSRVTQDIIGRTYAKDKRINNIMQHNLLWLVVYQIAKQSDN